MTQGSRVGTPEQFRWLGWIVGAVLVLNLLDAVFTLAWIEAGLATEANVVLADLVANHPVAFVSVKLALVSLGSLLLWWRRKRRLAVVGIFAVFLVYYFLLLYHLQFAAALLRAIRG